MDIARRLPQKRTGVKRQLIRLRLYCAGTPLPLLCLASLEARKMAHKLSRISVAFAVFTLAFSSSPAIGQSCGSGGCCSTPGICADHGLSCNYNYCGCNNISPIIIDTTGHGFHLTSAENGVMFDILADEHPIKIAWLRKCIPGSGSERKNRQR
jgi:hypothetical protein